MKGDNLAGWSDQKDGRDKRESRQEVCEPSLTASISWKGHNKTHSFVWKFTINEYLKEGNCSLMGKALDTGV